MTASPRVRQAGAFLPTPDGFRFRLVTEPDGGVGVRGTVVFVHPFAEEMNKSRRMASRMARLLAQAGWRVVQRDLRGCGDSAGDFEDATWAAWQEDVAQELAAADPAQPCWLWCLRGGALLAAHVLAAHPRTHLLLWQPVLSGAQHLQQFLRLHAGARIVGAARDADEPSLSPAQRLRAGRPVEVAGYTVAPALAAGLEQAVFDVPAGFAGRVHLIEVVAEPGSEGALPVARWVSQARARGVQVVAGRVVGPPFWQTQEIEQCDALLNESMQALAA